MTPSNHPCAAPETLEFRLLGPVEARIGGRAVRLEGAKQRSVLAALLLAEGRLVPDDRLCALLWGWDPPATWNAQLYTYASRLRGRLGPEVRLVRQAPGYRLDLGTGRVDLDAFQRDAEKGRLALAARQYRRAAELLRAALAHWHGTPLTGVTDQLAALERPELEERRLAVTENRIDAELALGSHPSAVPELRRLVAEHPTRERLRGQLMTALYRCDRQGDALDVYEAGRRLLAEELGLDPGPTLRTLHQQVLRGTLPRPPAPPCAVLRPAPTGRAPGEGAWGGLVPAMLPPDTADFTGRERELAAALTALRGPGLGSGVSVVLTGGAGTGKSALAIRAAHLCRGEFPDGQLYADLRTADGGARRPAEVLGWFLRALGGRADLLPEGLHERALLYRSRLAGRRILVVLDNAADERQFRPLLAAGEHSRTLVTGRGALAARQGARLLRLGPLDFPDAYQLLASADPEGVAADPSSTARIVELCDRLPLALRICAARLAAHPHRSPVRLAARLEPAHRRLDELRLGDLDVRGALRADYLLLGPAARAAFHTLCRADRGAFTTREAALLLGASEEATEELLEALTDGRLLTAAVDRGGVRYRIPSLVRLFGRERPPAEEPRWAQSSGRSGSSSSSARPSGSIVAVM